MYRKLILLDMNIDNHHNEIYAIFVKNTFAKYVLRNILKYYADRK